MDFHQSARRLNILDLPEEILFAIFGILDCPDDPEAPWPGSPYWMRHDIGRLKTMQALRLVCRRFCRHASHLLVPELRVSISPESLYRVDQLTRNPQIAAGVRSLLVSLAYRPAEVADTPSRYKELQKEALQNRIRSLSEVEDDAFLEAFNQGSESGDSLEVDKAERSNLSKAFARFTEISRAWSGWEEKERHDEFQNLLSQSYQEYLRKHKEQKQLLGSGSFVAALAESVSRVPSLSTLALVDNPEMDPGLLGFRANLPLLADYSPEALRQWLTSAHTWYTIENTLGDIPPEQPFDIFTVELLWQLPMALHAVGVHITHFSALLPKMSNFAKLCPQTHQYGNRDPSSTDWSTLAAAFQSLRSSHISTRWDPSIDLPSSKHMSPQNQAYRNGYLSAVLSSPALEDVKVNFKGLTFMVRHQMFIPAGSVFSTTCFPRIRRLSLDGIAFTEEELLRFFDGIGHRIETVHLHRIGVSNGGGWTRPLNILRDKVVSSSKPGKECSVQLSDLRGGGFDIFLDKSGYFKLGRVGGDDQWKLCWAAVYYVLGTVEADSLAEWEGNEHVHLVRMISML